MIEQKITVFRARHEGLSDSKSLHNWMDMKPGQKIFLIFPTIPSPLPCIPSHRGEMEQMAMSIQLWTHE
jgi:hypothetical protein